MPDRALFGLFFRTCLLVAATIVLVACGGAAATGDPTAVATSPVDVPIEDLLVYVPAGPFYMGSDPELDSFSQEDEQPLHAVVLDGYFIYRNEVSNGLYKQCVAAGQCSDPTMFEDGPSTHYNDPEYANNPVVGVTWQQAGAFCTWAEARLPTEAEWEKTARGENGDTYPWGEDAPSCDLSNMAGCIVDPPDTEKIGQFPEGESVYEADDMSGNVWEWTLDWYDEEYYDVSPTANPYGPEQGDLRVVRGGSYEDGPEALRSAERLALDPEEAYNNVGFRCVPIGVDRNAAVTPPFCQPNYVPFCVDPNGDPNEDCEPLQTGDLTPTPDTNVDLNGFSCPDGGAITVTFESDEPISEDHTITVGGLVFNCYDSTAYPGRVVCTGPRPPEGSLTTITVCPGTNTGMNGQSLVAYQQPEGPQPQQGGMQLVAYQPEQNAGLQAYQPTQEPPKALEAYQPTQEAPAALKAYEPHVAPVLMAYQATAGECPTGYILNPNSGQCEPDPNGACPDGWLYNEATGQCDPGDGGCPEGTTPGANGCEPGDGNTCPAGWFYDEASGSCQPPANDDGGGACPAGYFFDRTINCCSPIPSDNVGCSPGFYRAAATNDCQPIDQNGCPDGTVYNRYEGGCVHDFGTDDQGDTADDGCRLEGYVRNDNGQCVPGDTPVQRIVNACGDNAYYDEQLGQCVTLEEGDCGPGYRRNPVSNTCVPTDGPGSGCAAGYYFNERYNCCVATPGGDESYCLGTDQTATGRTLSAYTQPSATGFNYGTGYCNPTGEQQCPEGFVFDSQTQSCVGIVGRILTEETSQDECPAGTYYDENVGFCVQTSCGCELGTYYDRLSQTCVPYGDQGPTADGCLTFQATVPVCDYVRPTAPTCDNDERYNQQTQRCEPDEDPEPQTGGPAACSSYGSQASCTAAGCNWYAFSAPPCFP